MYLLAFPLFAPQLAADTAAASGPVTAPHVEVELIAAQSAVAPGGALTAGIRLKMQKGWHTYWKNPGDAGLPIRLSWKLPPGFHAGEIAWPAPQRLEHGKLVDYGYTGEIVLPVALRAPWELSPGGSVTLGVLANWLVCADSCIPGKAELKLTLPTVAAAGSADRWSPLFSAARARQPVPATSWRANARADGDFIMLELTSPRSGALPPGCEFFPEGSDAVDGKRPVIARGKSGWSLRFRRPVNHAPLLRLTGVLYNPAGWDAGGAPLAWRIDLPLASGAASAAKP